MITKVEINNFLSHKKTVIDLSTGFNVIVGPSDAGKSAVVRAIRWVIFNRPLGDNYRSYWGGTTSVSLYLKEGSIVTRIRTDKDNQYTLDDKVFNAVKSDVPDEIKKALNMDSLNLQTQFERHFLLSQTSGEVSKFFNKMANLDQIDKSLSFTKKELAELNRTFKNSTDTLETLEESLKAYDFVEELEADVIKLETLDKAIDKWEDQVVSIENYLNDIEAAERKVATFDFLPDLNDDFKKLESLNQKIKNLATNSASLHKLMSAMNQAELSIEEYEDITDGRVLIEEAIAVHDKVEKTELNLQKLESKIKLMQLTVRKVNSVQTQLENIKEERAELIEAFGEVCPTCGTVLIEPK